MILPLIKAVEKTDPVLDLEQKMVRLRALIKELNSILDSEYVAGMTYDPKSLKKFILRKQNCINRFEHLVRAITDQLDTMSGRQIPSTMPRNLVNRIKMIQGVNPDHQKILITLAGDLEQRHRELMKAARRNGLLFKKVLERMAVTAKYVNQGKMVNL